MLAGEWPVAQNGKSPAPGPRAIKSRAGTHISLGRRFLQPEEGDHTPVLCSGLAVINREAENGTSVLPCVLCHVFPLFLVSTSTRAF